MHVAALDVELHLPDCHTLKEKRAVLKPILETLTRRYRVSAAEVGANDKWQRARLGVAVVAGTPRHALDVLDEVERFLWSRPGAEVLRCDQRWLDMEEV